MKKDVYRHVSAMEPMVPDLNSGELAELCQDVTLAVGELNGLVPAILNRKRIAGLVRVMNCYYSNLIEGHKTLPRDIENAGQQAFPEGSKGHDLQALARAHIAAEKAMVERLETDDVEVYSPAFITWLHEIFYAELPESMREAQNHSGKRYTIVPGQVRDFMVDVGRHTPPDFAALPAFMTRFQQAYESKNILANQQLIAIAAAHHRLAWIHPFGDGNGRVGRLHSHALLHHHGLHGHGLWTLSRGLARNRPGYYAQLQAADQPRENDLDGRGHLSARRLSAFCLFFLETMLDQVQFMNGLLKLPDLRTRIERYFRFEALHLTRHREALTAVVIALASEGEIPRERVKALTGKRATTAAEIIRLGLSEGYFTSPSPRGALQFALPPKVWAFYFPQLFLDLRAPDQDQA